MESLNLLSGKPTKKTSEEAAWYQRPKTVGVVVGLVLLLVVGGYALTTIPLESVRPTRDNKQKSTESTTKRDTSACTPKDPLVLIYNRVPKAGSSSMTNLLSKLSSKHGFKMLGWFDMPSHDYEAVQKAVKEALKTNTKTVIAQHFHFPEIIDDRVAYINVLRHPVSRCTSQYYYLRYGDRDEKDRKKVIDQFGDLSIDDCIDSGEYDRCFNCKGWKQSLFFCGRDGGECKSLSPNSILERAKQVIDDEYTIGAIEDFEGTVAVMEKLYPSFFKGGLDLLKKVKPQRVTTGIKEYIPPSDVSKKIIEDLLDQDMQLYTYVLDRLDALKKQCL